jgi:hypothetical protein
MKYLLESCGIASDKGINMTKCQPNRVVTAAALAQKVLDLWTRDEDCHRERELQQVLFQTRLAARSIDTTSIEAEKTELVGAIIESMDRERTIGNGHTQGLRSGVWLDLLGHLSSGDSASFSSSIN